MPQGKPKGGRWNPSWNNLQCERERNNFKLAGLPCKLLRKPQSAYELGMKLVEELKVIEAQLTEWEEKQPLEFLELLPWWEERKKYREQKALGIVQEVNWWEAVSFLEQAKPSNVANRYELGLSKKAQPRKRSKAT